MEVVLRYKLLTAYTANTALHNLYCSIYANIYCKGKLDCNRNKALWAQSGPEHIKSQKKIY